MMTTAISIKDVSKRFEQFQALEDISLDIKEGEFFTLLGPSGCGKTTLLRLLGGFEQTTAGSIKLFDEEIESLPANKRPINTVFQHYALFPHMTIHENVQFGMKMLGESKEKRSARADEMLELVQLSQFAERKPHQLSGGQQQRVALARALAPRPKLLLLDEPLSALDLKLRQSMRFELKRIQKQTGITFVFVTHDQEEALTMSDRIAVMSAGHLQQVGTPTEIYEEPVNRFVADFIGESNFFKVKVEKKGRQSVSVSLTDDSGTSKLSETLEIPYTSRIFLGETAQLSIRPERIQLFPYAENQKHHLTGIIKQTIYMGTDTQYLVDIADDIELLIRNQNITTSVPKYSVGDKVAVEFDLSSARVLRG